MVWCGVWVGCACVCVCMQVSEWVNEGVCASARVRECESGGDGSNVKKLEAGGERERVRDKERVRVGSQHI